MKHPRFTAWLCSAAALVLLAVPAFAQQPDSKGTLLWFFISVWK